MNTEIEKVLEVIHSIEKQLIDLKYKVRLIGSKTKFVPQEPVGDDKVVTK